jgi:hypothetical protein
LHYPLSPTATLNNTLDLLVLDVGRGINLICMIISIST